MGNNPISKKLRDINYYLPKAYMFYQMKNEKITSVIFTLVLLVSLIMEVLIRGQKKEDLISYGIYFTRLVIIEILYAIYLFVYLKEQSFTRVRIADLWKGNLNTIFTILGMACIYAIINTLLLFSLFWILLMPPLFILYFVCMFNYCCIVDKKCSIIGAFRESKKITDGKKKEMFRIFVIFWIPVMIPFLYILISTATLENKLIFPVIIYFFGAIVSIMHKRFVALLYHDLVYGYPVED